MSRHARWTLGGVALVLALGLLLPAAADWLVTRDGSRIETDGPWRVEDRLIVFKHADGTLSSIRRSSIDLEASERLTREMAERVRAPRIEPQPAPRKAKYRLTEKDLPPVGHPAEPAPGDDGAEAAGDGAGGESLQVTSWSEVGGSPGSGAGFLGEVRNVTDRTALGIQVQVTLYDEADEMIATSQATLTTTALPPRESARFRASFPEVFHYARIEFRTLGTLVDSQGGSGAAEDEEPGSDS